MIHINDVTKQVSDKIFRLQQHELQLQEYQTEVYKSTVSHEMRTPLQSMLFLLRQMLAKLKLKKRSEASITLSAKDLKEVHESGQMIESQLNLMEAFVEDMLNLAQMRKGVFALVDAVFCP